MRFFRRFRHFIQNPEVDFMVRKLVLITLIVTVSVTLVLIGDICSGENIIEILTLAGSLAFCPMITIISVLKNRIVFGTTVIGIGVVGILFPVVFFFGGGVRGGAIIWIVFGYLYIGLVNSGVIRVVLIAALTVETIGFYVLYAINPGIVEYHNNEIFLLDSGISVLLVSFLVYSMVWFLNRMFERENARAREEAERAEEAIRTQNQFFSSMSHEIRTPINTVLGLNEIILRQEDASDEILRDARNIQGAGRMLLALINDILDISKIEAGKMDIVPFSYDVATLVSDIVNMIWLKATEKGLEFSVDIDPSIPSTLYGDEVRVKQILINLLNNAVKYTVDGSVTLHMECERESGDNVILKVTVSDTGIGIRGESLPHLFDSFQRVDEEKNRHIEGTGLGLSIVKQLVNLMGGEITVDSVYGQGSSFAVTLRQKIENEEAIGNLEIEEAGHFTRGEKFEHLFHAPAARILIVDDNEMNLEVEKKLLDGTDMKVDTVITGPQALKKTLKNDYDVIFLDHLMPGMDGIECYREIRRQVGGLNNNTPIVVLTANAGAENQELYSATGFDGYLMKPVSGKQMEEMLLRFLSDEKVRMSSENEMTKGYIHTAGRYARRLPVIITTSSMCDLPEDTIRDLQIPTIPFMVYTDQGVFRDSEEMVSDEMIRYMSVEGNTAASDAPSVDAFMTFFSSQLARAHHVIHIAITPSLSEEYDRATKAAKNFENVTVVNSAGVSSSTGLLVLAACRMVQRGQSVRKILKELEQVKKRIHCSFVIAETNYMSRAGHISPRVNTILKSLWIRPSLRVKKDVFGLDHFMIGNIHHCYEKYIRRALPNHINPDPEVLFITYVDVSEKDLLWIREKVRKRTNFKNIVFKKASSAISANCGPGTFGLLFMDEGKTDYNLSGFIPSVPDEDSDEYDSEELIETGTQSPLDHLNMEPIAPAPVPKYASAPVPVSALRSLPGIDADEAIRVCGSEETFVNLCRIFYDSMDDRERDLGAAYASEDWKDYTIRVHALKSSARLIGAFALGDDAEALEMAGKKEDTGYIRANHERVMSDFTAFRGILESVPGMRADEPEEDEDLPLVDADTLDDVLKRVRLQAEDCDDTVILETLEELDGYRIPDERKELVAQIREAVDNFDFTAIVEAMDAD